MSADIANVMEALFAHAKRLETEGPELPVSLPEPDVAFAVPTDSKYLVVTFFSNRPAWEGLTDGRIDQGLMLVTLVWPKNDGLIRARRVAKQVEAHFAKNTVLRHDGTRVRITAEPWTGSDLPDATSVSLPVNISWTA